MSCSHAVWSISCNCRAETLLNPDLFRSEFSKWQCILMLEDSYPPPWIQLFVKAESASVWMSPGSTTDLLVSYAWCSKKQPSRTMKAECPHTVSTWEPRTPSRREAVNHCQRWNSETILTQNRHTQSKAYSCAADGRQVTTCARIPCNANRIIYSSLLLV